MLKLFLSLKHSKSKCNVNHYNTRERERERIFPSGRPPFLIYLKQFIFGSLYTFRFAGNFILYKVIGKSEWVILDQ